MVYLTKEERLIYCDERFFRLIMHLMICDSASYMFVNSMQKHDMEECIDEF